MATTTKTTVYEDTAHQFNLQASRPPEHVEADIFYTREPEDGSPVTIESIHRADPKVKDVRRLLVKDVRQNVTDFTLEKNGFQYAHHSVPKDHFADDATIKSLHYPEIEAYIARLTGAKIILIYNHIVRNAPWTTDTSNLKSYVGPAQRCHIDVSTTFAREVVENQLKLHKKEDLVPAVLAGKWQLLNVWRPLKTVHKNPLAVADATTVPYSDQYLLSYDRVYMAEGEEKKTRVESPFTMAPKDSDHHFYYMHHQQPDEPLIFKTADSDETATAGAVTHTSFEVPGTEELPTRESIEIRLLAVY